jgi:hypothetical protein
MSGTICQRWTLALGITAQDTNMPTEKHRPELIARLPALRFDNAGAARSQPDIPPTCELFSKEALVERHPNLLTYPRVQWALRNRATNGLSSVVYESKSGQLLVHEPAFLRWYLGLTGRSKPRASRIRRPSSDPRGIGQLESGR